MKSKLGTAEERNAEIRRELGGPEEWSCRVAFVALGGCGGSVRPKTIPIDGYVTIDGKAPGESGKLFFTPTEAADGYSKRPASGSYNAEGHYRVISWTPDGTRCLATTQSACSLASPTSRPFPKNTVRAGQAELSWTCTLIKAKSTSISTFTLSDRKVTEGRRQTRCFAS